MRWQALIILGLFFSLSSSWAKSQSDLMITYSVVSNDVEFYFNQPVSLKLSACDKKEVLCSELDKSPVSTLSDGEAKAFKISLAASLPFKPLLQIISKRRIHIDDVKIKLEIQYARSDFFSKFTQAFLSIKELKSTSLMEEGTFLKESFNEKSGLVEISRLAVKVKK